MGPSDGAAAMILASEDVARKILARPELAGLQGPTISPVFSEEKGWYSVRLVVREDRLLGGVDHLREVGATDISAAQVSYQFEDRCQAYERLIASQQDHTGSEAPAQG